MLLSRQRLSLVRWLSAILLWGALSACLFAQAHTGTGSLPPPTISGVTASGFTVAWTTSSRLNTQVWYSPHASSPTLRTRLANWKLVTSHTATIAGLASGVSYDVQVESSNFSNPDLVSPVFTITTTSTGPRTLLLQPGSVSLQVGQTQAFTASYSDGSPVGSLTWSASNGGQISTAGVFTATAAGNFTVTADDGAGLTASATVTVATPPSSGLPVPTISNLTTTSFTLTWQTSQALNTQVHFGLPGSTKTSNYANWKLTTTHTAAIAGLQAGATYSVVAESSYFSNPDLRSPAFTVTLAPPPPTHTLALNPSSATLPVGQTQAFTASYSDNSPVGTLTWSVDNGGTISTSGVFSATVAGTFTVTVTDAGNLSASATVTVQTPPPPHTLQLAPSSATLQVGQTQAFTASYSDHSPVGTLTWSVDNGGTISTSGVFSATAAGTFTVTATDAGNLSASATVTVQTPPPPHTLQLAPSSATLPVGQTQTFTASYSDNSPVGTLTWSVDNGGTISTSGVFSATAAGIFTVTATDAGNLSASATVTVQTPPPHTLQLAPSSATLQVGQTQAFTASYSDNSPVGTLTWSVDNGGTISTSGVFSATAAGAFTVTATDAGNLSASATVTVQAPPPLTLSITPTDVVLIAGSTQQFAATYSDGSATTVTWTATNGAAITTGGSFDGSNAGAYVVIATDANGLSAMTSVQVEAPSAPPPAATCPGCFFTSPQSAWLYAGSTPAWGHGRDISSLSALWVPPGITTNASGFGMPVQHTQEADGFTAINDYNWGPGWRHDSASVPNPPNNQWTPSCGWKPPSQFGQTSCYGAYDGKDFIIDDTNGNFYEIDQLYIDSSGHPINYGVNGYGTGACGGTGQTVCGIRGVFSGNLATSAPNLGGSTAAGIVSGAGVIVPGELDCPTCLNHMLQVLGTIHLMNVTTCNAFPVGKSGDGSSTLPHAILCEGGIVQYTGDWTQLDPATHSPAVIALARALQLYGGMITDQGGTSSSADHITFYSGYDTAPDMTGAADLLQHLAVFYGTATLTGATAP